MGGAPALVCSFHHPLRLSPFAPTSFLPGLILLCVSCASAYPSRHEGREFLGLHYFFMGLDIGLAEVPVHPICWAFALIASLIAMPMGLLAVISAM